MKLIIGLGNPGKEYQETRHNVGFMVLDKLAKKLDLSWEFDKFLNGQIAKSKNVILLKPETFVNKSGEAVKKAVTKNEVSPNDWLVVHDDADLELGIFKTKKGGTSAGHRGIESIDDLIGSDYWRVRVGIGRDNNRELADFVLDKFQEEDLVILEVVIDQICLNLIKYINEDIIEVESFNAKEK